MYSCLPQDVSMIPESAFKKCCGRRRLHPHPALQMVRLEVYIWAALPYLWETWGWLVIVKKCLLTNGKMTACKKKSVKNSLVFFFSLVCYISTISGFLFSQLTCKWGEKSILLLILRWIKKIHLKLNGNILTGRLLSMTVQSWVERSVLFTVAKATRTLEYKAEKLISISTPQKNVRCLLCGSSRRKFGILVNLIRKKSNTETTWGTFSLPGNRSCRRLSFITFQGNLEGLSGFPLKPCTSNLKKSKRKF